MSDNQTQEQSPALQAVLAADETKAPAEAVQSVAQPSTAVVATVQAVEPAQTELFPKVVEPAWESTGNADVDNIQEFLQGTGKISAQQAKELILDKVANGEDIDSFKLAELIGTAAAKLVVSNVKTAAASVKAHADAVTAEVFSVIPQDKWATVRDWYLQSADPADVAQIRKMINSTKLQANAAATLIKQAYVTANGSSLLNDAVVSGDNSSGTTFGTGTIKTAGEWLELKNATLKQYNVPTIEKLPPSVATALRKEIPSINRKK